MEDYEYISSDKKFSITIRLCGRGLTHFLLNLLAAPHSSIVILMPMKKIFKYCTLFILISIIALFAGGFGLGRYVNYKTSKIYSEYMRRLKEDFKKGASLEEVKKKYPKYGAKFISLECSEGVFNELACPGAFRTHISIPLEVNIVLGEGNVLIYFYFTNEKKLDDYELYVGYDRFH